MFKKIATTLTILAILFGSFALTGTASASGRRSTARGTIVAIDSTAQTLTIAPRRGAKVTVEVDASTVIKRKGKAIAFDSVQVGDKASVAYSASTGIAYSVSDTPGQYQIEGTIESVDTTASTVTIASKEGGTSVTLTVDASTVITRNDATVALADLMVGDKVEAKYDSSTMIASKIHAEAEDGEIHGTIAAIDITAGTVTITPADGSADVVLTVDASTVIKRDDTIITLADLVVGDNVEAKYDTSTMVASKIEAEASGSGSEDGELYGTIAAIDTVAGTVTITPADGSADVVLTVDANTVIKRDDTIITLADLAVGDKVEAKYDTSTMIASKIEVENSESGSEGGEIHGTIAAIDITAGTVTITPADGSADVILTVDASTVIEHDDTIITLADLAVGNTVEAKYDTSTMIASKIEVKDTGSGGD